MKISLEIPGVELEYVISSPDIYEYMIFCLVRELWSKVCNEDFEQGSIPLDNKLQLLEE